MNKETDSVNDFGKYLEGKPAYKIYTKYKKILSEGSKGMLFGQKMSLYLGAQDDDELKAAIACFTLSQMDEALKVLHKVICDNPIMADAMKQMYLDGKMSTLQRKAIQYWRTPEGEKGKENKELDEAIRAFTGLGKSTVLRVLHQWAPQTEW